MTARDADLAEITRLGREGKRDEARQIYQSRGALHRFSFNDYAEAAEKGEREARDARDVLTDLQYRNY
jgi:hypothetical protein